QARDEGTLGARRGGNRGFADALPVCWRAHDAEGLERDHVAGQCARHHHPGRVRQRGDVLAAQPERAGAGAFRPIVITAGARGLCLMPVRTGFRDLASRMFQSASRGTLMKADDVPLWQELTARARFGTTYKNVEAWNPFGFTSVPAQVDENAREAPETLLI